MNADEFLALVEREPLPWQLNLGDEMDPTEYRTERGCAPHQTRPVGLPWWDDGQNLADSAPAMAAAILRLVTPVEIIDEDNNEMIGCRLCDERHGDHTPECPASALRASLPESLRP